MIIENEQVERCCECKSVKRRVREAVMGCDCCGKKVQVDYERTDYLELTIFQKSGGDATRQQFCSWECVFKKLPKIKCDYFISMPMLHYDKGNTASVTAKAFLKAIGRSK